MPRYPAVILTSLVVGLLFSVGHAGAAADAGVAAAVADPIRPDADKEQDENRKPAEVLSFAEVKPGMRIADFIPGGGYYTRLFSLAGGKDGHVYAIVPEELFKMKADADAAVQAIASDPHYGNVTVLKQPVSRPSAPAQLDIVFSSINYHDLHDKFLGPADVAAVNKAIFAALKPGGVYVVRDHAAAPGSGLRDTESFHRIDPAVVKQEVQAAGFVLDGETDVLRGPDDAHTAKVFDPALRGKTDRFLFKFRKPAKGSGAAAKKRGLWRTVIICYRTGSASYASLRYAARKRAACPGLPCDLSRVAPGVSPRARERGRDGGH